MWGARSWSYATTVLGVQHDLSSVVCIVKHSVHTFDCDATQSTAPHLQMLPADVCASGGDHRGCREAGLHLNL